MGEKKVDRKDDDSVNIRQKNACNNIKEKDNTYMSGVDGADERKNPRFNKTLKGKTNRINVTITRKRKRDNGREESTKARNKADELTNVER